MERLCIRHKVRSRSESCSIIHEQTTLHSPHSGGDRFSNLYYAMPDFSTPAEHAFEESTAEFTVASLSNTSIPLYERYEIPSCISEILENGYTTVALQFPDELLGESVLVYRALMKGLKDSGKGAGVQCYVLGDSTYGRYVRLVSICHRVLLTVYIV